MLHLVEVYGTSNALIVAGGSVLTTNLTIGFKSSTCDNWLQLDSGSVIVTNASTNAVLEVRRGKLILNGGTLRLDSFVMTNSCAQFVRTGGTLIYGTAVLDPNRDDDGDGITNGWEQAYGLDPLNAADASADSDGDGMSNLQEYLAGTDPTNPNSALRITAITLVGADLRVYFTSVGGKHYSLEICDFMGGAWTDVVTNIPGNDGIQWVKDIGGATRTSAFYRLILDQSSSSPPDDSDGDGIADSWTQMYFGHPTGQASDSSLATNDPDGDGMSNLQEYLAGTDPTNSASAFRITSVIATGDDVNVTWATAGGRTNVVQAATDLTGTYTNVGPNLVIGGSGETSTNYVDTGGTTNVAARFYRVRLVP